MTNRKTPFVYLLTMAVIAAASNWWGGHGGSETCQRDGQKLLSNLRVDLQTIDGKWHAFCSIECGQRSLVRLPDSSIKEAVVRDALTGEPIDAYTAIFVRSRLVTNQANGNNIHAFRYRTEAAEHMQRFHGTEIDNPFPVD